MKNRLLKNMSVSETHIASGFRVITQDVISGMTSNPFRRYSVTPTRRYQGISSPSSLLKIRSLGHLRRVGLLISAVPILTVPMLLAACSTVPGRDTIANLRGQSVEVQEEQIEGGLDKAIVSYQRFLEDTSDSELKPEALRRLADLKIEKEYGTLTGDAEPGGHGESEAQFERRTTHSRLPGSTEAVTGKPAGGVSDLERAGTREAIALYEKLLSEYPNYERNDQVLYQMSRAYEEVGEVDKAMAVMNRMVRDYPQSRNIGEVQFRRAEYFFMRKSYLDAEDAYESIVDKGENSSFYELALYKLGWTFYKQELYEDALDRFITLMDHKVSWDMTSRIL